MLTIGIDEVGRGCWAGSLAAAAAVLPHSHTIAGLNDSKKLVKATRERLAVEIREQALAIGICWVEPAAIDTSGITMAVKRAMTGAVLEVLERLQPRLTADETIEIIIDGSYDFLRDLPDEMAAGSLRELVGRLGIRTLVGADGLVPAVSAASIIAKVARDDHMARVAHTAYPQYGFDRHVGYGTAAHIAALAEYGATPLHRMSYKPLRAMVQSGS